MKAQSAVEYLMTYGWSILIIAVVIASLVELGVFNSVNSSPSSCIGVTGYSCSNPVLYASGALVTKLGQVSTGMITITGTACTKNSTVTSITPVTSTPLQSEQQSEIIFHCPLTSNATGTQFTGHLWIEYSTSSQQNIIQEVGMVDTPVVNANTAAYAPVAYVFQSIGYNNNLYIVNLYDGTTNIVTLASDVVGGSLAPQASVAVSPNGAEGYVADPSSGNFYTIDTSTDSVSNIISLACPESVAVSGSDAYVGSCSDLYTVNLGSDTVTNTISIPGGAFDVIVRGSTAYTLGNGVLSTVSLGTDVVTNTISADGRNMVLSPDGSTAYTAGGDLYTVDLSTDTVTNTLSVPGVGGAYAITLSSSGTTAYVGAGDEQEPSPGGALDTIDLATDTVTNVIYYGFYTWPVALNMSPFNPSNLYDLGMVHGGLGYVNLTTYARTMITTDEGSGMAIYTPLTT